MKITANDIVKAIFNLPRDVAYNYVNPTTKGKIIIRHVQLPEGPIVIARYDPSKKQGLKDAKEVSLSPQMIWRLANAIQEDQPVNVDRVFGGSYNTRSALEALIAHTPEFYYAYPGRIETTRSTTVVQEGHKHIIWHPSVPHEQGIITELKTDIVISEIPSEVIVYQPVVINKPDPQFTIEAQRRHAQIQIALALIGMQLGSRIWVAQNDRSIEYQGKKLSELQGIIPSLGKENLLIAHGDAAKAGKLIDCIWFRNSRFMPAVFEVEHSTGVTPGLARMKGFKDKLPPFETRYVIVAPDELREKVVTEANREQFKDLKSHFFPYTAVEELFSLCQRRKIKGVNDEFLNSFMEPCVT